MISLLRAFVYWPGKVSRLIRRQASVFIGACVLIGFVLAGMVVLDGYLRDLQIQEGSRTAQSLSYILSDQTDRSLQSVFSTVSKVVDRLQGDGVGSVAALRAAASANEIRTMLLERVSEDPFLDSIFIVTADGKISSSDSERLISIAELHGQSYLDSLRDASSDAVYVSTPFKSTINGTWQLSLSKRVSGAGGSFLGVVSGVVRLARFEDLLRKVALGEHGSISVFRDDGSIIACFPQSEIAFGSNIADSDLYVRFISGKLDGVTRQKSDVDGVDRMFSVVHLPKFPVAAVVAVAMNDIMANWLPQAEALALGVAVIVLAIAFGAIMLAIRIEQLAAAREREAVQSQVAVQYKRFNNAINNIVQGLAMYDKNDTLIACNKRYAEIYGLPLELTGPGVTRAQILAHGGDQRFGKASSEPRTEADGSLLITNELSDGRIIAQRKKQLADGGWVSTHEDITVRRRAEQKVEEMATHDALTGLSNRFEFKQRLEQCLVEVRQRVGKFAVLYVDLDHFKSVNDTLGHTAGDKLLREVAARIQGAVLQGDTVARLGGDEFAIIQRVSYVPGGAKRLAERLIQSIGEPYTIDGARIEIGTSVGISLTREDSFDSDELIRRADMALHHSKVSRGAYNFFQSSMDDRIRSRRKMEIDLRAALAEEQFQLYFQPVVSVADRRVNSFEALLRWKHSERGDVARGEFIPLAEENGLIIPIGEWVLREACREAAKWPAHLKVAVNVSVVQFKSPGLLRSISRAIEEAEIEGSRLIVEVTESVMIKDAEQAISTLHAIREMGIAIAMDDFGTGYSSLGYLRRFPFDKIKIDKSFIDELGLREDSAAIVRAATGLAKALGMVSVAEGVETEAQMARVGIEGCSEVQGYLISRPMPAREVCGFLGVGPRLVVAAPASETERRSRLAVHTSRPRVSA
jgi:diguanylate cyclase (GGDEF)-like protein